MELLPCGEWLLPKEAAPFLSFREASHPRLLLDSRGSCSSWSDGDKQRIAQYRQIGSDGAGNSICIDTITGRVVLLDHEREFQCDAFMNSNVGCLAECLLVYRIAWARHRDTACFRRVVAAIDPLAVEPGTFWNREANELLIDI